MAEYFWQIKTREERWPRLWVFF